MSAEVRCHQHAEQMKVLEDIDYLDDGSGSLMYVYMFMCIWGDKCVRVLTHVCACAYVCLHIIWVCIEENKYVQVHTPMCVFACMGKMSIGTHMCVEASG